jgi:hypothetical protein
MFSTASLPALAAVGALPATPVAVLSDEFNAPTLAGWTLMRGDDLGDGSDRRVTVEDRAPAGAAPAVLATRG